MGYPVAYRGGYGPRNSPRGFPGDPGLPPFEFGPLAGAAAALWLAQQLSGLIGPDGSQGSDGSAYIPVAQDPAAYGWTLTRDCGRPNQRLIRSHGPTCAAQIIAVAQWNLPDTSALTTRDYWEVDAATFSVPLQRYSNVLPAQTWTKGAGGRTMVGTVYIPRNLVMAFARQLSQAGTIREAGYHAPGAVRGLGWRSIDWVTRVSTDIGDIPGIDAPAEPIPVPRAIPIPYTSELKIRQGSQAGIAFMSLARAFNFAGDVYGLLRAMWKALPRHLRGKRRDAVSQFNDLYNGFGEMGWNDLLAMFRNIALWKFSDTVMGSQQASQFGAVARVHGYDAARLWSSVDSAGRAGVSRIARRYQRSDRGG